MLTAHSAPAAATMPYKDAGSTRHSATQPSRLAVRKEKQPSSLLLRSSATAMMQFSCGPLPCCGLPPLLPPLPPAACTPAAAPPAPAAALPPPEADAAAACCSNILMRALRDAERGGTAWLSLLPPLLLLLGLTPAPPHAGAPREGQGREHTKPARLPAAQQRRSATKAKPKPSKPASHLASCRRSATCRLPACCTAPAAHRSRHLPAAYPTERPGT